MRKSIPITVVNANSEIARNYIKLFNSDSVNYYTFTNLHDKV